MCGCPRESIFSCKCGPASQSRGRVLAIMKQIDPTTGQPKFDLSTPEGRSQAYDAVIADFVAEYGEAVLATPQSKFSWLLPSLGVLGGLGLLIAAGRRWVRRGDATAADSAAAVAAAPEDDEYADKLDDELAKTD